MPANQGGAPYAAASSTLVPLQLDVTAPQPTALASGTSMLVTDTTLASQLSHFPDLYDLRPTSHLMRLMQALLGESGVGQLRKRLLLAQWGAVSAQGARFYDLDRFYGAIFNADRTSDEQLAVNALDTATATPDEWEEMEAADASYRDRMTALARAVSLGGTLPGLKAAAEAVIGAPVEVFESWALLEAAAGGQIGNSWDHLEATLPTWTQADGQLWSAMEGLPFTGRSGVGTRAEVLVRIQQDYPFTDEGRRRQQDDEWALTKVLGKLKPASVLLTVDAQGLTVQSEVHVASASSDSEHWQVAYQVTPSQLPTSTPLYPLSAAQQAAGLSDTAPRVVPVPPLATRLGDEWSYGAHVPSARSYGYLPDEPAWGAPGSIPDSEAPGLDQTVVWMDGSQSVYAAVRGLLDPTQLLAARAASEGVLVAHPYSGDRRVVPTHD
ncbi:DUF7297 family protein [Kitasatospora viridis]|uniref:Uncharacterized protein n=1 Tax=Kitasatospora viridis TaxID=281105 RepID=A0A561S9U1_9ACTN|nr:hypothetical protein [Kitasatospora viridis]TWF71636.1 hypothetical protein FHX73_187 [Kitasatospora viridis]